MSEYDKALPDFRACKIFHQKEGTNAGAKDFEILFEGFPIVQLNKFIIYPVYQG